MWAEFEWENKVSVQTNISGMSQYLDHILTCTNMRCLTPKQALEGDCGFLAANMYAKSVFGEDALANIRFVGVGEDALANIRLVGVGEDALAGYTI